jgi:hypothetical protein
MIFSKQGMIIIRGVALAVLFLLAASPLMGIELYTSPPSHHCLRPVRPFEFTSQREIDLYRRDIEAYKNCLRRFIEEQNEAIKRYQEIIKRHQEAAKAAGEEWNNFVKAEAK